MIGKKALQTGVSIGQDVLAGENLKTATKKRAEQALGQSSQNSPQSGSGKKRHKKETITKKKQFTSRKERGSNFLSSLFREVCFLMNTDKIFKSGYRPQTNGLVERFNATLAQSLSMYVSSNQKDWDEHLNSVLFAYRASPSEVTAESPFYMLYGREPLLPMDTALLPPREMSPLIAGHRACAVEHVERVQHIAAENTERSRR